MKRTFATTALLALCAALLAPAVSLAEHHETKVKGSYVWVRSDQDIPGDIEAVFTPAGKGTWSVVFHFEWEGEMRAWKGEARGSLTDGSLEGEAIEDRGRERDFMFKGTVAGGVFKGTHGRLRDGEMNQSGTITFAAD